MSSKKATPPEKLIANAVYAQITNGLEQEALDTIDGNVGTLDFASTHGMYKDTLLTAALSNDLIAREDSLQASSRCCSLLLEVCSVWQ